MVYTLTQDPKKTRTDAEKASNPLGNANRSRDGTRTGVPLSSESIGRAPTAPVRDSGRKRRRHVRGLRGQPIRHRRVLVLLGSRRRRDLRVMKRLKGNVI